MCKKIVIIGVGGQGREVAFYISRINQNEPKYQILGFLDDNEKNHGLVINNLPVLGGTKWFQEEIYDNIHCIIAVGKPKIKKKILEKIKDCKINFVNIIDPSVIIDKSFSRIGEGVIIAPGSVILSNTSIEDHVLINYNAVIGHDCIIEKYATINPNVGIAGNVCIQEGAYVGIGTNIIQDISIGKWSIIGAGAVVIRNIPDNVTAVGIPAKQITKIK